MDDLEKLKRLLPHWKEHNDEHAESYRRWAETAYSQGYLELSDILRQLYKKSKALNELFDRASELTG